MRMTFDITWNRVLIVSAIIALLFGAIMGFFYFTGPKAPPEVDHLEQMIDRQWKEMAGRIEQLEREIKTAPTKVKERGDRRVQEVLSGSDTDFLAQLNEFSKRMVERTRSDTGGE